jgi:hypothetical protein
MNVLEMWMPVMAQKPEIADNPNWDEAFRDSVRNAGLPVRWLLEFDEVLKMRQARADAMEEQKAQMQQMQQAEMAGKIGGIKEDSMVGRAVANMGGGNGARR